MSDYKLQGNMTDAQIFEMLLKFSRDCEICRLAHQECRKAPCCPECEMGFWIREFKRHFGINENVG